MLGLKVGCFVCVCVLLVAWYANGLSCLLQTSALWRSPSCCMATMTWRATTSAASPICTASWQKAQTSFSSVTTGRLFWCCQVYMGLSSLLPWRKNWVCIVWEKGSIFYIYIFFLHCFQWALLKYVAYNGIFWALPLLMDLDYKYEVKATFVFFFSSFLLSVCLWLGLYFA